MNSLEDCKTPQEIRDWLVDQVDVVDAEAAMELITCTDMAFVRLTDILRKE